MEAWRAELYHHGILGQKWGSKNGPPYPLDYSKHSAREKRAGWTKSLSKDNIGGLRKKQKIKSANVSSDNKKGLSDKTKKKIRNALIIGGVAAGAIAGATLYKRLGQDYVDKVIKSGTTIQTLAIDSNRIDNGKHFYTTYTRGDKAAYNRLFSKTYLAKKGEVLTKYRITSTANEDAKIASNNSARKIYDNLMNNNPEFKKLVRQSFDTSEYKDHGREKKLHGVAKSLIDSNSKKSTYVAFNRSTLLSEADDASKKAKKMFFEEMKKHGYSGVNDINDQRYSGYRNVAKNPTIIFDTKFLQRTSTGGLAYDARKIRNKYNSVKLNKAEMDLGKTYAQVKGNALTYAPGGVAAAGAAFVLKKLDPQKDNKSERKRLNEKAG